MSGYSEERSYSLLPANSSALEVALDLGFARFLDRVIPPFPELMNPAETPVDFLSYLAAERGVAEWDADAPEAEKRSMVAMSWPTKRLAGTTKAIKSALKGLQLTADFTPWYKQSPKGAPYTFGIVAWVNQNRGDGKPIISETLFPRLITAIDAAKSERSGYSLKVGALFTSGWVAANGAHALNVYRRTFDAQAVQPDTFADDLVLANAGDLRVVYHGSLDAQAVQPDVFGSGFAFVNASESRAIHHHSADAVGVPLEAESPLSTANAAQARSVVRVTMEAVYL